MQTVVVLLLGLLLLAESSGSEQPLDVCAPDLVEPPEFCSKSAQCTPLSQLGKMALQLCPKMCGLCIDAGDHIGRLQGAAARDNRAPHPRGVSRSSLPSTVATTATLSGGSSTVADTGPEGSSSDSAALLVVPRQRGH